MRQRRGLTGPFVGALADRFGAFRVLIGSTLLRRRPGRHGLDVHRAGLHRERRRPDRRGPGRLHRPELLILDEPTSGLDPLVQQSFYTLIREAREEGRTVFLSSHILSEVERTCGRVAIIRDGLLVKVDSVEGLRDLAHHEVELRFVDGVPAEAFRGLPGVSDLVVQDHVLRMRVSGPITPVVHPRPLRAARFRQPGTHLEETFLASYGHGAVEVAKP